MREEKRRECYCASLCLSSCFFFFFFFFFLSLSVQVWRFSDRDRVFSTSTITISTLAIDEFYMIYVPSLPSSTFFTHFTFTVKLSAIALWISGATYTYYLLPVCCVLFDVCLRSFVCCRPHVNTQEANESKTNANAKTWAQRIVAVLGIDFVR
jgi:hypothetical protein